MTLFLSYRRLKTQTEPYLTHPRLLMHVARHSSAAVLAVTLLLALPTAAQTTSQPEALQAIRSAVNSELAAAKEDHSIWMYKDRDDSDDRRALYDQVETREGDLRRLIELNGQPLSPADAEAERQRILKYVNDPSEQAKSRKNSSHDDSQAEQLLKMLPEAFLWTVASQDHEYVTLSYIPNPAFNPPNIEARVMGIMGGQVIIAREGDRIRTLKGRLTQDVKFGYGLFGRLNQGGTFDIERRQVGGGHWQITESHVHIGGKALLFKNIGQQADEVKTDWRPSPAPTLVDAARVLGVEK
jgi:hypothetical protein